MNLNTTVFVIIFLLTIIFLAPLALIWAFNTLFSFSIAFTGKTWLAALVLLMATGGIKVSLSAKN